MRRFEFVSLQSINIPESVTEIGEYAFGDCIDLKKIHIPSSIKKIGIGAFSGCGLEQITVDNNNPLFDSRDDCNAIISKDDNRLIIGCKNTIIPLTVTIIGSFAFESCEIEEITIPNNIIKIEDYAFSNCSKLEIIYIPKGERSKFEKLLPEYKEKLEEIYQDEKDYLTDFVLPDGSIYNGESLLSR